MRKLLSLFTALLFVGTMWGDASYIDITKDALGLSGNQYASNSTGVNVGGVTIKFTDCNVNNSATNMKASSGCIWNSTALPQKIDSIVMLEVGYSSSSSAGFYVYGAATAKGTTRTLYDGKGTGKIKIDFTDYEYDYFYIKNKSSRTTRSSSIKVYWTAAPTAILAPKSLPFGSVAQGAIASQTFTITGSNLTGTDPLTLTVVGNGTTDEEKAANAAAFSVSCPEADLTPSSKSVSAIVTVSAATSNAGTYSGYVVVNGGGLGADTAKVAVSISVKAQHAVTVTTPAAGTGTLVVKDGDDAIGETVVEDKELTVIATPNTENHYIGGTIKVIKTGVTPEADVTSTVYNAGTGILTMPAYDITVSATFTPTYAITAAIVTGGTFSWEDDADNANPEYVAAGTLIQAAVESTATGYTFDSFDIYKTGESTTKVSHISGLFTMPAYAVTISGSFNKNTSPEIVLSQTSDYLFDDVAKGTSPAPTMTFTVSAANLGNNLTVAVSGTNADKFGLSENTITISEGGVENYEITVTPIVSAAGAFEATITVDDGEGGATAQSFDVIIEVLETYTAQWFVNGTELTAKAQTAVAGAALNVPEVTVSLVGKTFVGWIELDEDITAKDIEDAGGDLIENEDVITPATMPSKNVQYRAVYANETKGDVTWEQTAITSLVTNDVIVIVGDNGSTYAMSNDGGTQDAPTAVSVTIANSKLSAAPAANIQWTFVLKGSNQYSFAAGEDTLYCINNNNGLRVGSGANNIFSITSDYLYNVGQSRYSGIYKSQDWRSYGTIHDNIKGQTFSFFKKVTAPSTFDNYVTKGARLLADPTFSVAEGAYATAQSVELAALEGDIYYTIDGTTPTSTSTKYTSAISISAYGKTVLNAIAIDGSGNYSEVATATYYIAYPSFAALIEANPASETQLAVNFSNILITETVSYQNGESIFLNAKNANNENIEIFSTEPLPTGWAEDGYVSGSAIYGTWFVDGTSTYLSIANWSGISYTDTPTALEDVETSVKAVKVLQNGVLYIEKNGKTFNAMGQLVK